MLNFHGNVEGNDIFKGTTDIVVCDGFVGNVVLKTSEGLAAMLCGIHPPGVHAHACRPSWPRWSRCRCSSTSRRASTPAATTARALLGLRGLVFKSHGSADAFAFEQALARAYDAARNGLLDRVHDRIVETLQAMPRRRRRRRDSTSRSHESTAVARYSRITGTGSYLPPRRVTNDELAARAGRARHRDLRRVDRRAHRHPRAPLRRRRRDCSDLALHAARHALEAAGRKAAGRST